MILRHTVVDDEMQVVMESTTAVVGNTIRLAVVLKNNPGLWGMTLLLEYDESVLTLVHAYDGNLDYDLDVGMDVKRLMWSANDPITADGVLCVLEFQIAADAPVGDYSITMVLEKASGDNSQRLYPHLVSSVVSVIDIIYGDVNDDGLVDVDDVLLLRRYVANYNPKTGESTVVVGAGADANADGLVDVDDVLLLRRYVANYNPKTGESTVVLGPQ